MYFDLLNVISILIIFQCSIFSFFLVQRRQRKRANLFLSLFFLSQTFIVIHFLILHNRTYFIATMPYLFFIGTPFYFLISPSLYFYTKSLAFSKHRLTRFEVLHFIPFFVAALFYTIVFHIHSIETKRALIESNLLTNHSYLINFDSILFTQIAIYIVASLLVIWRYRKAIKEEFSTINSINLSWLNFILYGFLIAWLTSVVYVVYVFIYSDVSPLLQTINYLAFFIFFNIIFYHGLVQPELFLALDAKPRYITSRLSQSDAHKYAAMLASYMETNKPHLEPTITLKDLSDRLSIPLRFLSQIINEYHHRNFFDFINQYRIEESKRLLRDPMNKDKTVLDILYDVGFSSKSSFNTAFKKVVGLTPTQFRNQS